MAIFSSIMLTNLHMCLIMMMSINLHICTLLSMQEKLLANKYACVPFLLETRNKKKRISFFRNC